MNEKSGNFDDERKWRESVRRGIISLTRVVSLKFAVRMAAVFGKEAVHQE